MADPTTDPTLNPPPVPPQPVPPTGGAVQPTKTLRDMPYTGTAAEKQLREYAQALMKQQYTPPNTKYPFYTWANGLNDASAKIMGGMAMRQADDMEKQRNMKDMISANPSTAPRVGPGPALGTTPPVSASTSTLSDPLSIR